MLENGCFKDCQDINDMSMVPTESTTRSKASLSSRISTLRNRKQKKIEQIMPTEVAKTKKIITKSNTTVRRPQAPSTTARLAKKVNTNAKRPKRGDDNYY